MILNRRTAKTYVDEKEQKPGVNKGALLWLLIIAIWLGFIVYFALK